MKSWNTTDGPIDENTLFIVGMRIPEGYDTVEKLRDAPGCFSLGTRQFDLALQLLKKQGRIAFDHKTRRWTVVKGGAK